MLKKRVIPTLLWKDYGLVKGVGFDSWRRVGTIMPAIKVYNTRNVDELILVDITATAEARDPDYDVIAEFSEECFVPLTFGGGIVRIDQIRNLLRCGVDKVAINSAAYANPELIKDASGYFGSQCIVASVDVRLNKKGNYECFSHCGTVATGRDPVSWVRELAEWGAGEILLTSVERDGSMQGFDLQLIRQVAENVAIPVIASGGAGNYDDFLAAFQEGGATAVAAASIFHFTQQTPAEAKDFLGKQGIPVRNVNIKKVTVCEQEGGISC